MQEINACLYVYNLCPTCFLAHNIMVDVVDFNEHVLISSVELINFMCHDHLILKFSKPFTCIGGRNGSGKSAIMISLGILFGQRSSSLERGNSLKKLIKTGEQFFVIKCVLQNTKKFMYDFFGDFIIIEKKVTVKSNTFTISNKYKRNYSTKIEDLEYLLEFYNIKIENPLNYLTQEQSKKFLSSSNPSQLYKLFIKGTEIAEIKVINNKYETNISELKNKIENIEKNVAEINEEYKNENRRMEILENIENLKTRIITCENEKKWSRVYIHKQNANEEQCIIKKLDAEINTLQEQNTGLMEEIEKTKQDRASIIDHTSQLKQSNKIRLNELDERLLKNEKVNRLILNDLKELKGSYDIKRDLVRRFEKSNTFVDKRETLYKKRQEFEQKLDRLKNEEKDLVLVLEDKKIQYDKHMNIKKAYDQKLYALENQIRFFKMSGNDVLSPNMSAVINQIKRTSFQDQIIGPIGNYIKLKDQKWWKPASIILKNILTSFICFNLKDREKLMGIFKNNRSSFTVLIPSSKSQSAIRYEKNNKFVTLLDVLHIDNKVVLNQLIIMINIEQIALMDNRSNAYQCIRKGPQNVDSIYLVNGDRIRRQGDSISDYAPRKQDKYFFENPDNKKKEYQDEYNSLLENKPSNAIIIEYDKTKDAYDKLAFNLNSLERKLYEIHREIENSEEMFSTQKDLINNEELFESCKSIESQISLLNNKIKQNKNDTDRINEEKNALSNAHYPAVSELDKDLHKLQIKLNISNDNIMKTIQKKMQHVEKVKGYLSCFEAQRLELLHDTTEISEPRCEDIIEDEIANLNAEIIESKKVGNKEETKNKLKAILEQKQEYEDILKLNKSQIQKLCESCTDRIRRREEIMNFVAENACKKFAELTRQRGYKGQLTFDHNAEQLHIEMIVHNYDVGGSKETFSGGERSFAAMSLLFSLWPYISCPVKILDEFDVFMDDLNRKFIIQKFIEYYKKAKNQIILITPLNTKYLENDDVDIQILNPPERTK